MTRAERLAGYVAQLPPAMRGLLEHHLAAGNELLDFEVGQGDRAGQTILVMDHPFRSMPDPLPDGIAYRESLDRDPRLFEFHTLDERWSLLTAKWTPIVFEPTRPIVNEGQDYVARVLSRQAAEALAPQPPQPAVAPMTSPVGREPVPANPAARFLASMTMTYDMWHDGAGYDLDALKQVPADERPAIEAMLLARNAADWRDVEALAQFDTPAARAAVLAATTSGDIDVRRTAMRYVPVTAVDPRDREAKLIDALRADDVFGGLSQAIDEAAEFHPPAVVDALLRGALKRPGQPAVLFAGLLFFIHGKSGEAFDWSHRPFFLRFDGSAGRAAHHAAFAELCATIGVDPAERGLRA